MRRYFIGTDDSGHHYVVPVDRRDDFEKWVGSDDDPMVPAWMLCVTYALPFVTFTDPTVMGLRPSR